MWRPPAAAWTTPPLRNTKKGSERPARTLPPPALGKLTPTTAGESGGSTPWITTGARLLTSPNSTFGPSRRGHPYRRFRDRHAGYHGDGLRLTARRQAVEGTEIVAWPNAGQAGLNIYGQTYGVDKTGIPTNTWTAAMPGCRVTKIPHLRNGRRSQGQEGDGHRHHRQEIVDSLLSGFDQPPVLEGLDGP